MGGRADDVGGTADRRDGLDGGADGSGVGVGGPLPAEDGVGAEEEEAGRLAGIPGEEAPDLEDAEALGGGEVRAVSFGDLGEAVSEEVGSLPGEAGSELGLFESGLEEGEGVFLGAEVPEVSSRGEAEEVSGAEHGTEGRADGRFVVGSTEAEVNGGMDLRHVVSSPEGGWASAGGAAVREGEPRMTPPAERLKGVLRGWDGERLREFTGGRSAWPRVSARWRRVGEGRASAGEPR
jgi:hypothetical protein